jgi:hypothetical protein
MVLLLACCPVHDPAELTATASDERERSIEINEEREIVWQTSSIAAVIAQPTLSSQPSRASRACLANKVTIELRLPP